jgi:hypothetical protein
VADVARVAAGAVDQPPAEHQPAPDTGRDDHAEDVVPPAPGPAPVLADRHADRVVVHPHHRVPLAQPLPQREVAPGRDVERAHLARRPGHRAAAADADPGVLLLAHLLEQRDDGRPRILRRGLPVGTDDAAAGVDDGGRDLRTPDVERERVPVHENATTLAVKPCR